MTPLVLGLRGLQSLIETTMQLLGRINALSALQRWEAVGRLNRASSFLGADRSVPVRQRLLQFLLRPIDCRGESPSISILPIKMAAPTLVRLIAVGSRA